MPDIDLQNPANPGQSQLVTLKDFATQTLIAVFSPMVDATNLEEGTFTKEEEQALFKAWRIRNQQILERALGMAYEQGRQSVNAAPEIPKTSAE